MPLTYIIKLMKFGLVIGLCLFSQAVFADGLPVITVPPANQIVSPGDTATLTVTATSATSFQWRFNGADISGATNSTLQVPNAQTNNAGYYMAVAKNATGWVPSQMAWLSVVSGPGGEVPISNLTDTNYFGQVLDIFNWPTPLDDGWAQVVAGPALDQMQPVGYSVPVNDGYYSGDYNIVFPGWPPIPVSEHPLIPTVAPGQNVYYQVVVTYANSGIGCTQPSTVLSLTAGGDSIPIPSTDDLNFPPWWAGEGIEPELSYPNTATNQVRIPGETFSLTNTYRAYTDFGAPTAQWRKNGRPIIGATNFPQIMGESTGGDYQSVLMITNVQPDDAGIYDLEVFGNNWFVGPKTVLSILITNGPGVFQSPRFQGTNFVCDLLGAAGRNYTIQWSTDLFNWNDLRTVSNVTGTIAFTNSPVLGRAIFYRTRLQP